MQFSTTVFFAVAALFGTALAVPKENRAASVVPRCLSCKVPRCPAPRKLTLIDPVSSCYKCPKWSCGTTTTTSTTSTTTPAPSPTCINCGEVAALPCPEGQFFNQTVPGTCTTCPQYGCIPNCRICPVAAALPCPEGQFFNELTPTTCYTCATYGCVSL